MPLVWLNTLLVIGTRINSDLVATCANLAMSVSIDVKEKMVLSNLNYQFEREEDLFRGMKESNASVSAVLLLTLLGIGTEIRHTLNSLIVKNVINERIETS